MMFEVHGPTAAYRIGRFASPERAIEEASRRIYTSRDDRAHALVRLEAGKDAHFVYGFSEVAIYARSPRRDSKRGSTRRSPSRPTFEERLYETRLARESVNADFLPLFDHLISLARSEKRQGYPQEAGRLLAKARKLTKYGRTPDYTQRYGRFDRWDRQLGGRGVDLLSKRVTSTVRDKCRRTSRRDPSSPKKGDRFDNFGEVWVVVSARGNRIVMAKEVRDSFGKVTLVGDREWHPRTMGHMTKLTSDRDRSGRRVGNRSSRRRSSRRDPERYRVLLIQAEPGIPRGGKHRVVQHYGEYDSLGAAADVARSLLDRKRGQYGRVEEIE